MSRENIVLRLQDDLYDWLNEQAKAEGVPRSKVIDSILRAALKDVPKKIPDDQKRRQKMYNQAKSVWDHLKPGWKFWPIEDRDVPTEHSAERLCPECQCGDYHCHGKPNIFPARAPLPSRLMVRYKCKCWCATQSMEARLDALTDKLTADPEVFPE